MEVDFSKRLRELREGKRLTQTELARKINVTGSMISACEAGTRQPSHALLMDIAKFFHVSMDDLYGLSDAQRLDVSGLKDFQIAAINEMIDAFRMSGA